MRARHLLGLGSGIAMLALASPAAARDCADLTGLKLEGGTVARAEPVGPGGFSAPASSNGPPTPIPYSELPPFCRVTLKLTPTADSDINAEVWLPASGWNGKLVGIGNGAWAGEISYSQMGDPLSRGYAVVSTDTGHSGNGTRADWAVGHFEKLVDFGHRAIHLMTVGAKTVIRAHYGEGPAHSLWTSCSTGGRQGLMSAYRYPEDYDAISSMAPANPMTGLMVQSLWTSFQSLRAPGMRLTLPKLAAVHKAVLAQCDAQDGLVDGIVSMPDRCDFEPGALLCKAGDGDNCLTAPQVEAMRNVYDGLRDPRSGAILRPGFPLGAELALAGRLTADAPSSNGTDYFSLLVHGDTPGWDWRTMDFASELAASRAYAGHVLDVPADGLDTFFARGGKLLLSHGWNDGAIPAGNTLEFYGALYRAIPLDAAQNQLRLFMAPGMEHCAGGEGPNAFDVLGVVDEWATTGVAPARIVATREPSPWSSAPALPPISRPLCPWPMVARFDGDGDPAEAASFSCVVPD